MSTLEIPPRFWGVKPFCHLSLCPINKIRSRKLKFYRQLVLDFKGRTGYISYIFLIFAIILNSFESLFVSQRPVITELEFTRILEFIRCSFEHLISYVIRNLSFPTITFKELIDQLIVLSTLCNF